MDTAQLPIDRKSRFGSRVAVSDVLPVILAGRTNEASMNELLVDTSNEAIATTVTIRLSPEPNGKGICLSGDFEALDTAMTWLLSEDRRPAADRNSVEPNAQKLASLAGSELIDKADAALRARCEFLRDMRWELMATRVEMLPSDRLERLEPGSIDQLYAMMRPD